MKGFFGGNEIGHTLGSSPSKSAIENLV